jgi:hypothetical protein
LSLYQSSTFCTILNNGFLRQEIQEFLEQIFVFGAEGKVETLPLSRRKNKKMPKKPEYLTDKSIIQKSAPLAIFTGDDPLVVCQYSFCCLGFDATQTAKTVLTDH